MERKILSTGEIAERSAGIRDWTVRDTVLHKRFEFPNFAESLVFVNRVGEIAESLDHHPDIKFGWGYAELETTTHDRGGLTDFDFGLARRVDEL